MRKIKTLYRINWDTGVIFDAINPGNEWAVNGEGVATVKMDGTACMWDGEQLFKRYDRKLTKAAAKKRRYEDDFVPTISDFKPAPEGFIPCDEQPDLKSGHWPGWVPIGSNDKWHMEAKTGGLEPGTYELVGPKIGGNPYKFEQGATHRLVRHGSDVLTDAPTDLAGLGVYLMNKNIEGIVWHHPDGRMAKMRRTDFGHDWPIP